MRGRWRECYGSYLSIIIIIMYILQDLPPIEQCDIAFPGDGRLLPIATVSHYTEKLCQY